MWFPGLLVFTPLWGYIDQCKRGTNTIRVRMEKLTLLTAPQDTGDNEDDISIDMKSGFCTQSSTSAPKLTTTISSLDNQFKFSKRCQVNYPRLAANAFFDYPMMIKLNENDIIANDHSPPFYLNNNHFKVFQSLLQNNEGKSANHYTGIHIKHIFRIGEQKVPEIFKTISESLDDFICISAIDVGLGALGKKTSKAISAAVMVAEAYNHKSGDLDDAFDMIELCPSELETLFKSFNNYGGTAYYMAQFVVEDAVNPVPENLEVNVPEMDCWGWSTPEPEMKEEDADTTWIWVTVGIIACCCCCCCAVIVYNMANS